MDKQARGTHTDPLSAASAGLLALAVPRRRRTHALELLAAMLDLADDNGDVLLDGSLYAVEQRLGVNECLDAYTWLELTNVVHRTGSGWSIPAYDEHSGPVGDTAASMAVLSRHLERIGKPELELVPAIAAITADPEESPARVVALRRWRRTVPIAVGIAASVAALTGAQQLLPQAASHSRDVAVRADAPTTQKPAATGAVASTVTSIVNGIKGALLPTTSPTTAGIDSVVTSPVSGPVAAIVCAVPKILTAVTSVSVVRLPLVTDEHGAPIWAAIVNGTATNTSAENVLVSGLTIVAHVVDGDTAPVQALLATPLMLPGTVAPFSAIVALGSAHPETITATAEAVGNRSTC